MYKSVTCADMYERGVSWKNLINKLISINSDNLPWGFIAALSTFNVFIVSPPFRWAHNQLNNSLNAPCSQ